MNETGQKTAIYWESFLAGDKDAFAHYYNLHIDTLYSYGTKLCFDESLIKDAIQEIFLELYLKRNQNDINPLHLRFYLIKALKHNILKKLKRNHRFTDESFCDIQFEPEYNIEANIIKGETEEEVCHKVNYLLNQLPAKQKEALYLRFNEGLEYQEISKILNISVESVRKLVYRAIRSIRNNLDKKTLVLWIYMFRKDNFSCHQNK